MLRYRRTNHSDSSGFTLVELLTVMAIISVLSAILFPVYSSSKASARESACLENLRQIGMAVRAYSDDWNGFMPDCLKIGDAFADPQIAFNVRWPQKLHVKLQPYCKSTGIFRDPADTVRYKWNETSGPTMKTYYEALGSSYQSYGQLDLVQDDWKPVQNRLRSDMFHDPPYTWPVHVSNFYAATQIRIVRDAIPFHIRRDTRGIPWKWNELYLDGHVANYKSSQDRGGDADRGTCADTGGII